MAKDERRSRKKHNGSKVRFAEFVDDREEGSPLNQSATQTLADKIILSNKSKPDHKSKATPEMKKAHKSIPKEYIQIQEQNQFISAYLDKNPPFETSNPEIYENYQDGEMNLNSSQKKKSSKLSILENKIEVIHNGQVLNND